jgi:hypothetical protein
VVRPRETSSRDQGRSGRQCVRQTGEHDRDERGGEHFHRHALLGPGGDRRILLTLEHRLRERIR